MVTVQVLSHLPLLAEGLSALLRGQPVVEVLPPLSSVATSQPPPDVLLVDALLPGLENALEGWRGELAVIVFAQEEDVAQAKQALHLGARGYLALSSRPQELLECIGEVIRGEVSLPPALTKRLLARMQTEGSHPPVEPLSERELEVLALLCQGFSNKAIAQKLYLSVRTVEGHLANLYAKLGVSSRTQAALVALNQHLVAST